MKTPALGQAEPQALRAFVAVAREGNVSRAAQRLHLSQPAVSLQLKALAEATGLHLFTRTPKGMALTQDGAALLPLADKALSALADFGQAAAALHHTVRGTLRIGTILDPEFTRLGAFLKALVESAPQIGTELRQGMSGDVLAQVTRGDLDVGFFSTCRTTPPARHTGCARWPASATGCWPPPAGARRCAAKTGRPWPRCPGWPPRPPARTTACCAACSAPARSPGWSRAAWPWLTRKRRCWTW